MKISSHRFLCLIAAASLIGTPASRAVILYRTGDPGANTTAPTGDLANSGWQFEGFWGAFLGTPIAPHFFLSAAHIGQAGSVFTFQSVNYTPVKEFVDPYTDLAIWQVAETFPTCAPLYTKSDEVGKLAVVIGRGTQRGGEVDVNGNLAGWYWGASDNVERWGENIISDIVPYGPNDDLLYGTFDANGLPDEATLSVGDSGGAAFIEDNGVWKLAGIHYAVDGPFYTDSSGDGEFFGALFDSHGLYYSDGGNPPNYILISGDAPVPTGFYPTRVSSRLSWILSIIGPLNVSGNSGTPALRVH